MEKREQGQTEYVVEYAGKPLRKFRRSFRTACLRAGITYPVVMYDVRHLFATTLLNQGGDLSAVSALLGHSSTQMTANTYYHLQKGEKQRAVALLPRLGGVVEIPCAANIGGEIVSQGC